MKELIDWLNTNKDIIIFDQTNNSITLKWKWNGAGFHLCIYIKQEQISIDVLVKFM